MAKKKPVTTKLDATVKATHRGMRNKDSLPERKKSVGAFRKAFSPGGIATLWIRRFDQAKEVFYLDEVECVLLEASINCFYYEDENGRKKSNPWWAVYDFEIEGGDEPITDDEPSGDVELPDEQGPGANGGDSDGGGQPDWAGEESADI